MGHLNGLGAELMGQRGTWGRGGVGVGGEGDLGPANIF